MITCYAFSPNSKKIEEKNKKYLPIKFNECKSIFDILMGAVRSIVFNGIWNRAQNSIRQANCICMCEKKNMFNQ